MRDVARHLQVHRSATGALSHTERALDDRGSVRCGKRCLPFRDRCEELFQIEALVRGDLITLRRELPAERENRRTVEEGVRDTGDEIRGARAECAKADPGNAGQ